MEVFIVLVLGAVFFVGATVFFYRAARQAAQILDNLSQPRGVRTYRERGEPEDRDDRR